MYHITEKPILLSDFVCLVPRAEACQFFVYLKMMSAEIRSFSASTHVPVATGFPFLRPHRIYKYWRLHGKIARGINIEIIKQA